MSTVENNQNTKKRIFTIYHDTTNRHSFFVTLSFDDEITKEDYFSFGDVDTLDFGWKQSNIISEIPNQDLLFITDKIIGLQCIMFPKHIKKFLFDKLINHKWDASDIYFNIIFSDRKKGILYNRITSQCDVISFIDKQNKIFRK